MTTGNGLNAFLKLFFINKFYFDFNKFSKVFLGVKKIFI